MKSRILLMLICLAAVLLCDRQTADAQLLGRRISTYTPAYDWSYPWWIVRYRSPVYSRTFLRSDDTFYRWWLYQHFAADQSSLSRDALLQWWLSQQLTASDYSRYYVPSPYARDETLRQVVIALLIAYLRDCQPPAPDPDPAAAILQSLQ